MSEQTDTRARVDPQEVAFRKIFIGGLSYSTDEEKLKKYFKQYGTVQDAVVMKDPVSKRSRGFGFITFVDVASVDNALAHEPHTIDSRKVEAKRAVPRSEISRETAPAPAKSSSATHSNSNNNNSTLATQSAQKAGASPTGATFKPAASASASQQQHQSPPSQSDGKVSLEDYAYNKIFVGGLHYDTRDAEFRLYFEKYGKVISAEVMFNRETHKSRGFGFIVFEVESSAVKVCNVKEHSIDGKVVEVKRAIPRSRLPAGTSTAAINAGMLKGPPASSTNAVNASAGASVGAGTSKSNTSAAPATGPAKAASIASTASHSATQNNSMSNNNNSASTTTKPRSVSGSGPSVIATGRKPYSAVAGGQANTTSTSTATPASTPAPVVAAAATGIATLPRTSGVTSYAAALKGAASTLAASHDASMSNILSTRDQAASHLGNSGLNLQTLVYTQLGSTSPSSIPRPSRSYSEPIVKFEGSSELNKDSLPFDEKTKSNTNPAGAAIKAPSGKSSRSNSIAQAPANFLFSDNGGNVPASGTNGGNNSLTGTPVSLGNLPWLSSPPSNPLDPTGAEFGLQLPPPTEQQKQLGLSSAESAHNTPGSGSTLPVPPGYGAPPPGIMGNNGQWFNAPPPEHLQAQQAFLQHQAAQQQQFNQFGGMMYMPGPYGPAPGVAPSPDMWAAMVSSHQMHHEHHHQQHPHQQHAQAGLMGMPPQPFMMPPPFGFFGPDGAPMPFPGATPQQQQMMFFQAQQHMQASYSQMQQLHYQNHAQALALAQAQAQMAALGAQQQQQPLDGSNKPAHTSNPSINTNSASATSASITGVAFPAPGLGYPPVGGVLAPVTKPSENTENDDLFHFNELNLDSPVFDPSQAWISANRR